MINENVIAKYKKIYELPELEYEERVSDSFFKLCEKKHYFVIISVYNLKKEILLIRDFNKSIGWELPGGYVKDDENIEQTINRVAYDETGLEIDELLPVAIVKNIFKSGNKTIVHSGIAFTALSRGNVKSYPKNIQTHFIDALPQKVAYQNDKIISIVKQKLSAKRHTPPFEEIDSLKNKKFSIIYFLHKYVIKHIGNLSSNKIKLAIFSLIEGRPRTILDASCGESSVINELCNKYKPEICVGNDISWKAITLMKNKNPAVIFTNHNVLDLPYKMKFDLVIFKNTLHHIESRYQKDVLKNLQKIAKQLIVVDIDDPQNSTFRSKLWNDYYVYLLGDQGDSSLTFEQFKKMCSGNADDKSNVGIINTIKGRYFYATINNH